jgi:EmrB/QacA subfamily drug resistance transporter
MPVALALLVAGTLFMEILDGTILATAAPSIGRSFGVESTQIGVCVTAYVLTLAVLIPLSGWATDRFGARRIYVSAIVTFTLASVLCAISANLTTLVAARVLQGVGGAMMVPVGRLVVLRAVDKQDMIRAVAYLTWPALLAPVVAPAAGGLLSTYTSWRWIFIINVPLGVIAAILALRLMPAVHVLSVRRPMDWLGFVGSALALGGAVVVAAALGEPRLNVPVIVGATAVAIPAAAATVHHLRQATHPLLHLELFRIGTFRTAHGGGGAFRIAVNSIPFLLPLLFQDQFGWSAAKAGIMVLFVFVGNLVIKPITTPSLHRFGFRLVLMVATFFAAASIALCALFTGDTPLALIAFVIMLGGAFRSIGFSAYNTIAFADVEQSEMNDASTLAATAQQLAQGLGVAYAVVTLRLGTQLWSGVAAYRFSFVMIAVLLLVAFVASVRLPVTAGDRLRPVQQG